jgi:AcrR family transcriptional regulator
MSSNMTTGHKTMKSPPRERILSAAEELFHREGIRGVGVEAIAERAGTTKMAIYRHFESKDALVAEWLQSVATRYEADLDRLASQYPGDPRAQLLGWAETIAQRLKGKGERGCPFINSVAELPDRTHPGRRVVDQHKGLQSRRVVALCHQAGIPNAEQAAQELLFVLDGAQVCVQSLGGGAKAGEQLVSIVKKILGQGPTAAAPRR